MSNRVASGGKKPSRFQIAAMKPRVLARIQEAAAPFLEPGERLQRIFFGQTGMPTGYAYVGAILGFVKYVIVAASEQNIYVFQRGLLTSPHIKGLLARYRIEPGIPISFGRGAMQIGSDTYWVAALIAQQEARYLVEYVESIRDGLKPA